MYVQAFIATIIATLASSAFAIPAPEVAERQVNLCGPSSKFYVPCSPTKCANSLHVDCNSIPDTGFGKRDGICGPSSEFYVPCSPTKCANSLHVDCNSIPDTGFGK